MNKNKKRHQMQLSGGIGANVVDGDLQSAIRFWKQDLKMSKKIETLYNNREYIKPSTKRKRTLDAAKYRNKFKTNI